MPACMRGFLSSSIFPYTQVRMCVWMGPYADSHHPSLHIQCYVWWIEREMDISSMFAWVRTLWQSQTQRGKVIEVVLKITPAALLRAPLAHITANLLSLFRLKVTLSRWSPFSVITTDCLTATDITSLKTCLAYCRLVPLVGAVGHVPQTVTVDQCMYACRHVYVDAYHHSVCRSMYVRMQACIIRGFWPCPCTQACACCSLFRASSNR